ncbi:MAG: electron transfer flavoprotein subunit alpha/FixB family protein [Bacteroidota bacterium]
MSVLVYIESSEGKIKKSCSEAVSYASQLGGDVIAVCFEEVDNAELASTGKNGAGKVITASGIETSDAAASALAQIYGNTGAHTVVMAKSSKSGAIASRLAAKINASMVSNVVSLPDTSAGYVVKQGIFTGSAFANIELKNDAKILILNKNIVEIKEDGAEAPVESFSAEISAEDKKVVITNIEKATGKILLPEAEIVVSAGRGLKGPENWGMVEDLTETLGAAIGCSKPVSDMDWRPHSEHVGQTGIKVGPNLYIAIGISGAIQHLAGVNSSKHIVVINTDEEAPFFKSADYGIVGDAFDIVPKLTEAIKAAQ